MSIQRLKVTFVSMGCPCEIEIYAQFADQAEKTVGAAVAEVERLDKKYSHYKPHSELARIQSAARRAKGTWVDAETAALLNYCDAQYQESKGLFDITAGPLCSFWEGRTRTPDESELAAVKKQVGWSHVKWSPPLLKIPATCVLNLGGVVKEYAADRAALILRKAGVRSGLVNLGGDIHVVGPKPGGRPWQIGINNPVKRGSAMAEISIESGGLATSGDYERYTMIDGVRYGHIINPLTAWPVSGLASVSVCAPSCLVAGSLATLAMLRGEKGGLSLLKGSGFSWLARSSAGTMLGCIGSPDADSPQYSVI